jgi:hypothetical protein
MDIDCPWPKMVLNILSVSKTSFLVPDTAWDHLQKQIK